MYYLGIDSGGTKAAFLLGDETGRIYARYRGEGCTVLHGGYEGVRRMVAEGVEAVCQKAGITPDDIAALGLGISGYGEGETAEIEPLEACESVLSPGRAICRCDTYVGWAGALRCTPGINVIAGTGSVVYGVNEKFEEARAGGWGCWGAGCDEGSCTWHGQQLVQEWTKQADGRHPRTALYDIFRDRFHVTNDDYFIHALNVEVIAGRNLPELQRLLKEICEAGDPAAKAIYERGAAELCLGIRTVAKKLGIEGTSYPVSYAGGLFNAGECALEPLRKGVEALGARLVAPEFPPDVGALMMAIQFKNPDFDPAKFQLTEGA